jgi:hypothetical protein
MLHPIEIGIEAMTTVAFYSTFRNIEGIALRDALGAVSFQTTATGTWTTLTNADAADLQLHGRVDLAAAAALADGALARLATSRQNREVR